MIVIELFTLICLIVVSFCLGIVFSPIVLIYCKIKEKSRKGTKDEKENFNENT